MLRLGWAGVGLQTWGVACTHSGSHIPCPPFPCLDPHSSTHLRLHLPAPNPFIPTDLSLAADEAAAAPVVALAVPGRLRLWHKPDTRFGQPKAVLYLDIQVGRGGEVFCGGGGKGKQRVCICVRVCVCVCVCVCVRGLAVHGEGGAPVRHACRSIAGPCAGIAITPFGFRHPACFWPDRLTAAHPPLHCRARRLTPARVRRC